MKKTMKRYLSLLLALIMLLTSFSIAASAEAVCQHEIASGDPNYCKVVNPTCDTQGYTIYYCTKCSTETNKVEAMRGDYKNPLGHDFDEGEYKSFDNGESYRLVYSCTNKYAYQDDCNYTYVESEDGEQVVYYRVDFINNKVTGEDGYCKDVDYTNVADPEKFVSSPLYSTYVKAGEEAVYEADKPYREKTKAFAKYAFRGWTTESDLEATADNTLADYECSDLIINENTQLFPVFEGLTHDTDGVITHDVRFYNFDKNNVIIPITNYWPVVHGGTPLYSDPDGNLYDPPVKEADLVNTYEFKGWSTKPFYPYSENLIAYEDTESVPIYGDVGFYPVYTAIPKNYTVMFYDSNAETLLKYTDADGTQKDAVFNGINLKKNLLDPEVSYGINALNANAKALEKPGDANYIYTWNGKWAILNADGTVGRTVDLTYFDIYRTEYNVAIDSEGNEIIENGEQKKIIRLVPVYERKRQLYAVDIEMLIPRGEDNDYYRGGADVHVVANNNQLVASGTTDANGFFRCYLYNQTPFTVTVATSDDKYIGTATITSLQKAYNGTQSEEANMNLCRVQMELNPEYETHCRCIHHNPFIQPIWVRILNILYHLFNFKYVCCYDMYSTIGPLLDYTA